MSNLIDVSSLEIQLRATFANWAVQQVQSTSKHVALLERRYVEVCLERDQIARQRIYDMDQQADTIRRLQNELENAERKLVSWETLMPCGHPESALIMDDPPHCAVCDQIAEARAETNDALDHLRTCPPNMCRDGHPEIRYEQPADGPLDCPLCYAIGKNRVLTTALNQAKVDCEALIQLANERDQRRYQDGTKADH